MKESTRACRRSYVGENRALLECLAEESPGHQPDCARQGGGFVNADVAAAQVA